MIKLAEVSSKYYDGISKEYIIYLSKEYKKIIVLPEIFKNIDIVKMHGLNGDSSELHFTNTTDLDDIQIYMKIN